MRTHPVTLLQRGEFVLDVVQQVFSITPQLAVWRQGQAATKAVSRTLVQRPRIEVSRGLRAPQLVRCEFVQPARGVPEPGVVVSHEQRTLDHVESLSVLPLPRHQQSSEMFQRAGVLGVRSQRVACQGYRKIGAPLRMRFERPLEEIVAIPVLSQRSPSTSASASCSLNTRNVFVRTLPWLLTAGTHA